MRQDLIYWLLVLLEHITLEGIRKSLLKRNMRCFETRGTFYLIVLNMVSTMTYILEYDIYLIPNHDKEVKLLLVFDPSNFISWTRIITVYSSKFSSCVEVKWKSLLKFGVSISPHTMEIWLWPTEPLLGAANGLKLRQSIHSSYWL